MWVIYAVVFHILLLGSIFVIYFRSPVIQGLKPQPNLPLEAPARRLVLIVADGLRAQSFFYKNLSNVPNLRQLIKRQQGLLGISHTRVPTESRPGHIALIAGLYEDPSAVTRGWKENPIEFDTIFQRARRTYAWGSHDILRIFNKWSQADAADRLVFEAYNNELDFWGNVKTYELDKWVFSRVTEFLKRKPKILPKLDKVYFFLHLLGLDTAGHIHKPQTDLFLENLFATEAGIYKIYQLFEEVFKDQKTAYVLTSDHGMTNSGSHGAGQPYETETPFYIWGAGINSRSYNTAKYIELDANIRMPLYDIEQAQMAPLMSAVLGLPPPVNNFGILPRYFLNASEEYIARAVECNAYQLLEQYVYLLKKHKNGILSFLLPEYSALTWTNVNGMKSYLEQAQFAEDFKTVTNISYALMEMTLKGIEYYQNYYSMPLLFATTISMLSWLRYLLSLLDLEERNCLEKVEFKSVLKKREHKLLLILLLGISGFCILQKLSWEVSLYLLLPIPVMALALTNKIQTLLPLTFGHTLVLLLCIEFLVLSFFSRQLISVGFVLHALLVRKSDNTKDWKYCIKTIMILILAIFPLLPPSVGYTNNRLFFLGFLFTISRPMLVECKLTLSDKLATAISLLNAMYCVHKHINKEELPDICQFLSWSYFSYVFIAICYRPFCSRRQNLERVIFLMTSLYSMLCTSYELHFILLLITELILTVDSMQSSLTTDCANKFQLSECFRVSFSIILYTFFSFFGTGNMASVSSFDPNIMRCFLTTFSPFVIMFLVILKLSIPVFLIVCIIFTLLSFSIEYEKHIFICLLLICDIMALHFLYMVRNHGSWLEIGTSISHFVIMQVTTLILVIFTHASKLLLVKPKNFTSRLTVQNIIKIS
uniref:GPI ethanolamine phosphate transferase 1 n=1 Tax=Glossina brevipalpis TaxID=37001 RepID=A0A1A9W9X4_9MUSC